MESEDILFKYKYRKPKEHLRINYGGLELEVNLFEPEKKKEKRDIAEKGSFLLNRGQRVLVAGDFYVFGKEGKKLAIENMSGFEDDRKQAVEAVKKYADEKGYVYVENRVI